MYGVFLKSDNQNIKNRFLIIYKENLINPKIGGDFGVQNLKIHNSVKNYNLKNNYFYNVAKNHNNAAIIGKINADK